MGYTMESSLRTISVKCYDEQIMAYFNETDADTALSKFKSGIKLIDPNKFQVLAIVHDKDYGSNDWFAPAIKKRHIHIIGRSIKDGSTNGASPSKVSVWLKKFCVKFRQDTDEVLFKEHGVETVAHFTDMAKYLTHETPQAIADGKHKYEVTEIISNLNSSIIEDIRQIYTSTDKVKYTAEDMEVLDKEFYIAGYNLKPIAPLYENMNFSLRSNRTKLKSLEDSYYRGVENNIKENNHVDRLCIFIHGEGNTSKTYSAQVACRKEFGDTFVVNGGKTGKFDDYEVSNRCLIINDYWCDNLLNVCDNYKAKLYKRNSGTPYFCGDVVIITSNKSFNSYICDCNITDEREREAMKTRFFVCGMVKSPQGFYQLAIENFPKTFRGDTAKKVDMVSRFITAFNESARTYIPTAAVDENIFSSLGQFKTSAIVEKLSNSEDDGFSDLDFLELPFK